MSATWNSRTRVAVDGKAFKSARIMFKNTNEYTEEKKNHLQGEPLPGSQEWLAEKANISPRAVSTLENGKASISVVDAVSSVFGIKGRQYIKGYGGQSTKVSVTHFVDFRPTVNGRIKGNEETYANMPFLVTLDPINIKIEDEFIEEAMLKSMKLKLSVGEAYADKGKDISIDFIWLNNVNLTETAKTWLGDPEEVSEMTIKTGELHKQSIMFRQDSTPLVTWKKFCEYIIEIGGRESMAYPRILLTLILKFEYFETKIPILVSIPEIRNLIENSYPENCPYWIQPKALMP